MADLIEDINRLKEKINSLTVDLDNIINMSVPQRIVCKLIKIFHMRTDFRLPITKTTFALQVGIEKETLSRSIPKLEAHGVSIDGNRNVSFFDKPRMIKTVCDHCAGRDRCREFRGL